MKNKSKKLFYLVILICLNSCIYSDGSFWFERSNWGRTFNNYKERDRIKTYKEFDINNVSTMLIRLKIPYDIKNIKQTDKIIIRNENWEGTRISFNEDFFKINKFKEIKIELNKIDIQYLNVDILTYINSCLNLLIKNKEHGFSTNGISYYTDNNDTNQINETKEEYYYYAQIYISNITNHWDSKNNKLLFYENVYYSEIYPKEISINCFNIDSNKTEYYKDSDLTFKREVCKDITYKLINSILNYKNNQIDLLNDSLKLLNKPLLEKYTWYK